MLELTLSKGQSAIADNCLKPPLKERLLNLEVHVKDRALGRFESPPRHTCCDAQPQVDKTPGLVTLAGAAENHLRTLVNQSRHDFRWQRDFPLNESGPIFDAGPVESRLRGFAVRLRTWVRSEFLFVFLKHRSSWVGVWG